MIIGIGGAHLRRRARHLRRVTMAALAAAGLYKLTTTASWSVCPLASRFRSQLQELQARLKRAILEYVILVGSPRTP